VTRTALITGITGQDGSYLAELLRDKAYRVVGVSRRAPIASAVIEHVEYRLGDVGQPGIVDTLVREVAPDEIYHLASETTVARMWDDPGAVSGATAGVAHVLNAVRRHPSVRVLLASSSEIFGMPAAAPQDEGTPIAPVSPYGATKAFALWMGRAFRHADGVGVSSAILFNHESPRRPPTFVTRKITRGVADIVAGRATELRLGDLDARRDWGFAGDYADAMWRILQAPEPEDFVIGTGVSRSVREFCQVAFSAVGLDYRDFVVQDPTLMRPGDERKLVANPARARDRLGWSATTPFASLVEAMVTADLEG
jgi:GDPmannose 4,6-dehydratase